MKKIIFALGLAMFSLTSVQAPAFFGGDGCCEDGPLTCNAFGMQVKGGVTPSHFTSRSRELFVDPSLLNPVFSGRGAKFDDIFNTPWQAGAELQWNASTHVQFFAEYVYNGAEGKRREFLTDAGLTISRRHADLKANSFYLGARYFFGNVWCDPCMGSIAPFVGFKGGFTWHERTHYDLVINDVDFGSQTYNHNQAAVSAGAQMGLDWSINCNWGVVFTAEAVVTQGFRTNNDFALPLVTPPIIGAPTNVILGGTGRIVSYPVTLGLRYTF